MCQRFDASASASRNLSQHFATVSPPASCFVWIDVNWSKLANELQMRNSYYKRFIQAFKDAEKDWTLAFYEQRGPMAISSMAYDVKFTGIAMALAQPAKELGSRVSVVAHIRKVGFFHSISSNWRPSRGKVRDVHNGLICSCIILCMNHYETSPKIHKHIIFIFGKPLDLDFQWCLSEPS